MDIHMRRPLWQQERVSKARDQTRKSADIYLLTCTFRLPYRLFHLKVSVGNFVTHVHEFPNAAVNDTLDRQCVGQTLPGTWGVCPSPCVLKQRFPSVHTSLSFIYTSFANNVLPVPHQVISGIEPTSCWPMAVPMCKSYT
jgi:hypothetical protein